MKILQVSCEGLGNGGVQSVIMNICRNLQEFEFDIILFTDERRYYDDEFEKLGGKIYTIPHRKKGKFLRRIDYYIRLPRIFFSTYRILKKKPYDVIHCHNELESGICNMAAFLAGVKVRISHSHTIITVPKEKYLRRFYDSILRKMTLIFSNFKVGCTVDSFSSFYNANPIELTNAHVIPNPIDLNKFKRKNITILDRDQIYLTHIGKFSDNKNQKFLLRMMPFILEKNSNMMLQLVGAGDEYKRELENIVRELGIENHIQFLPSNSDIPMLLEKTSLFLFPSKNEGFGIVLLEAQAMGVPCLASSTVPSEVDCGLIKKLSISKGEKVWAKNVIDFIGGENELELHTKKIESFDVENYIINFRRIYVGNYFLNK